MHKKKNLLFKDFDETFSDIMTNVLKNLEPEKLERNLDKIPDLIRESLPIYEESISTRYVNNHKFRIEEFMKTLHKKQAKIVSNNKETFESFHLYISICDFIFKKIIKDLDKLDKELNNTVKLAISLYGLCVRRGKSIAELLISGNIDSAMIIWRSLYENAVILLTLVINDSDELSERFIAHSYRNSNRKISAYSQNHFELKFPPLSEETHKELEEQKKILVDKYGRNFIKNDYGWADILFTSGKADFRRLEEKIKLNLYRPYYVLCSEQMHSSINGFEKYKEDGKYRLHRLMETNGDIGSIADPMQFTAGVLDEINNYIIYEFSVETELNANLIFLRKLFEKLNLSFKADSKDKDEKS